MGIIDTTRNRVLRIKELGWEPPQDTNPNSTNCLLNSSANRIDQEQYGFHPYAFEIVGLIRMGVLSREEGLKRLDQPGDERVIEQVREELSSA